MIENVIILDNKRIIVDSTVDELKQEYYMVSGNEKQIDEYITGKQVVHVEQMSGFKSVTIKGQPEATSIDGLEFGKSELQKLFINITKGGK